MPFPSSHAARQSDPSNFVRFRIAKNKGGKGIDFVFGFKKGGGSEVQSVRFNKKLFTPAQARKWLKAHGFSSGQFEPATKESMMASGPLTEIKHEPSFEELRDLVDEAIQEKFPTNDPEHPWRRRFFIKNLWASRVLLQRDFYDAEEDDPKYSLLNFNLNHDPDQGEYQIVLGEVAPVSIQAVPKNGGEGVIIDEAGRRNSSTDVKKMNTAMRAIMGMMSADDFDDDTMDMMKDMMGTKAMKPMNDDGEEAIKFAAGKKTLDRSDEGQEPDKDDALAEAWANLPGETFQESFIQSLSETRLEKDNGNLILRNTVILGPKSSNGRLYPVETQKKSLSLFEGAKAYLNHPRISEMSEPRDVEDLIGEHKNVRIIGEKTVSDLYLVNTPLVQDYVLPIAESKPHLFGNSIVARGKMTKSNQGMVVEEILAVRSVDLVAEPATTNSLFAEGKQFSEGEMELKDLTMEILKKDRPDLFEAIVAAKQSEDETKTLKDKVAALEQSVLERDGKIATYELERAKSQKDALIDGVFKAAKIPDRVKYTEKDGVKSINQHFRSLMERCQDDVEMKELVKTWEETYRQGPISDEKRIDFGENGNVSEAALDQLYRAVG